MFTHFYHPPSGTSPYEISKSKISPSSIHFIIQAKQEGEWVWLCRSNEAIWHEQNLCRTCWQLLWNQGLGKLQANLGPSTSQETTRQVSSGISRSNEDDYPPTTSLTPTHHWSTLLSTATWFTTLWILGSELKKLQKKTVASNLF